VIAPGLRVVDVEPDGFGVLCALVPRHDRITRGELHLLHDDGRVVRAVHTVNGPTQEHREPLGDDLPDAARRLRERAGVDRVVLVDRDRLVTQESAFAAVGPSDIDQPTTLHRSRQLFWASDAVVTDPAPPTEESWEALGEHLRALGDDYWGLLAGYDGDVCAFTLAGRFVGGQLALMTSLRQVLGDERPVASRADQLVQAAEHLGPVRFVLIASVDVIREVARSDDPPIALAACAPRALITRGLPT
jgi:hypothetical protein